VSENLDAAPTEGNKKLSAMLEQEMKAMQKIKDKQKKEVT
tara:strand:+ start:774 stop:893 length:120 start_codon:yes stop_codon:yes gene_type:complete